MSLKDAFNEFSPALVNRSVLRVNNGCAYTYYDFAQRIMMTMTSGSINSTPFSALDREVLVEMRDRLVALKGTPPELPPEAPEAGAIIKKFNL